MPRIIWLAAIACTALACTSTYHPEYHPVTVTEVHQSMNAPVVVEGSSQGAARPVVVAPPPQGVAPLVIPEPSLADPEVVFRAR